MQKTARILFGKKNNDMHKIIQAFEVISHVNTLTDN